MFIYAKGYMPKVLCLNATLSYNEANGYLDIWIWDLDLQYCATVVCEDNHSNQLGIFVIGRRYQGRLYHQSISIHINREKARSFPARKGIKEDQSPNTKRRLLYTTNTTDNYDG